MKPAIWEVVKVDHDQRIVWIIDDYNGHQSSVTNDAERVVETLHRSYPNYCVIYRDIDGQWDELRHESGIFKGFAPARDMAP